ncbi:MAG: 3'-5' exonuclease [Erythrobacter sp.]|nr:3'-5' exonuclease [Erythrobacter sp.]
MINRAWAVDVEGSGNSPPEIVELSIAEVDDFKLTGKRKTWRVRPEHGISPIAARIHGIHERDVEDAPSMEDVADDILEWLGNDPIIGHNVRVELDTISQAMTEWSPSAAYDTLKLARRLLPEQEKHGLGPLGKALKIDIIAADITGGQSHNAEYDAVLSALLLKHLLDNLTDADRKAELEACDTTRNTQGSLL